MGTQELERKVLVQKKENMTQSLLILELELLSINELCKKYDTDNNSSVRDFYTSSLLNLKEDKRDENLSSGRGHMNQGYYYPETESEALRLTKEYIVNKYSKK